MPTALLSPPAGTPVTRAVAELLRDDGWHIVSTPDGPVDALIVVYLNRLSDLLFVLARRENQRAGKPEDLW